MLKKLKRFLARWGLYRMLPHEKAEIGLEPWGRQEARAEGQIRIKARIYRAATDQWEEIE